MFIRASDATKILKQTWHVSTQVDIYTGLDLQLTLAYELPETAPRIGVCSEGEAIPSAPLVSV